jgi:hypothetical protein
MILSGKIKDIDKVKKTVKKLISCPNCKKEVEIGIEYSSLHHFRNLKSVYYPHIHLHGSPLHALICYLNSELMVRNITVIKSIEISRDSETFKQIINKWTNPF